MIEPADNNQLILIVGESTKGKSSSLRNIRNQEKYLYLGTESGETFAPMRRNTHSKLI